MRKWKLEGSSLIEVLSGLSLLSLILGLGLGLFQRLGGPLSATQWSHAQAICKNVLNQHPLNGELSQGIQQLEVDGLIVERQVSRYPEAQNICTVKVSCKWKGHLLAESVRLSRIE